MRPSGKKKATAKKTSKKVVRKPAARVKSISSKLPPARNDATLAARIHSAPELFEPKLPRIRVAQWLDELAQSEAKPLKALLAEHPTVDKLLESLAESSPFLWELASGDPQRLLGLLGADPDLRLARLLADQARAAASCDDEVEAMRLLRRMKAEAALLIALADIGGV